MLLVLTVVSAGPEEGRKLSLGEGQKIVVGREVPADVAFPNDGYMSGQHFSVEIADGMAILRDLGSRNKTKVNGQVIREISLTAGDIMLAGGSEFLVDVQQGRQKFDTTDREFNAQAPAPEHGQSDVFDEPFDKPADNSKVVIGEPGITAANVNPRKDGNPLPPPSAKKKSGSPIQSMAGSTSPLFGGGAGGEESSFGSPLDNLAAADSRVGKSPFASLTGGSGVENLISPPPVSDSAQPFDPPCPLTL
jgi:pSer/pThr/pTyr-binding forkhead associated (FHA) protein